MSNKITIKIFFLLVLTFPYLAATPFPEVKNNITSVSGIPSPVVAALFQTISYTPENDQKIDSVIIPLKRAGRLLLVEANVDGETGNLLFDTGANNLVLNSTYFRSHVRSDASSPSGITGSVGTVEQITIDKIEFANLTYKKIKADLTNLGHIENSRGIKILGLFGFNMIRDFEIILDTKNNQLKLYRIDKTGNRIVSGPSKFRPDYSQLFKTNSNILFLSGKIGGRTLDFCFDTGAETNVVNSYSSKNILNTLTITRRSGLRGAGSSRSEVLFGRMNDFTLGSKRIAGMETVVSNLEALSDAYGTKIDGILGFNFIEQGIVCINFVKRQFGIQFMKGDEK
ncbi:MAG: pepsin/retropepsin-like aspartic protease family protein [Prolixibacteraceae bacterium]|nr:pepsin/retropepsin-like aspartic protease family protein [Prolixibacteraceae bacterium]